MIKSYTDIEQSKVLAKILPVESADMRFCCNHTLDGRIIGHYPMIGREPSIGTTPCWSLAALLSVIPNYKLISEHNHHTCTAETSFGPETVALYDNPIDACYKMILKLHEKKFFVIMRNSLEKINREIGAKIRGEYGICKGNEIIRAIAEAKDGCKYPLWG